MKKFLLCLLFPVSLMAAVDDNGIEALKKGAEVINSNVSYEYLFRTRSVSEVFDAFQGTIDSLTYDRVKKTENDTNYRDFRLEFFADTAMAYTIYANYSSTGYEFFGSIGSLLLETGSDYLLTEDGFRILL